MLTEKNLTLAIAAQMYEMSVIKGYTFDCNIDLMHILDPSSQTQEQKDNWKDDEIKIVNHIFVRNCAIERDQNPCLSEFELSRQNISSTFDYAYEPKSRGDPTRDSRMINVFEDGSLKKADSIYIIDELLKLKQLYQDSTEETKETNEVEQEDKELVIQEMNTFNSDTRLNTELKDYITYALRIEYKMLVNFYPNHKLIVDEQLQAEQLSEVQNSAHQPIFIDAKKVGEEGYLDKLVSEESKPQGFAHIPEIHYVDEQLEKTDLYRFMKHCLPNRYHEF